MIVATIILLLIQSFLFGPHPKNLAYSDFKVLLAAGVHPIVERPVKHLPR